MQFSTALVLALTGVATALPQTIDCNAPAVPACATTCLANAAVSQGCGATDWKCQCANKDAIRSAGVGCLLGACSLSVLINLVGAVDQFCAACN